MQHRSARQYSDQMVCTDCGRSWDTNDLDPPPCEKPRATHPKYVSSDDLAKLRKALETDDWSEFE